MKPEPPSRSSSINALLKKVGDNVKLHAYNFSFRPLPSSYLPSCRFHHHNTKLKCKRLESLSRGFLEGFHKAGPFHGALLCTLARLAPSMASSLAAQNRDWQSLPRRFLEGLKAALRSARPLSTEARKFFIRVLMTRGQEPAPSMLGFLAALQQYIPWTRL